MVFRHFWRRGRRQVPPITSQLNGENVEFKWAAGDQIKVTVSDEEAVFTLKEGAGTSSASFVGVMPASGNTFDVQYPVKEPNIGIQVYSSTEAIPHDKMLFMATGCDISEGSFELKAQYAALRLNLYGSEPIGKIKIAVREEMESRTYTLNCGDPGTGITPGTTEETATPFLIIIKPNEWEEEPIEFTAEVFDKGTTAPIDKPSGALDGSFSVAGGLLFSPEDYAENYCSAGQVLNMPPKEVIFPTSKYVRFSKGNLQATYSISASSYTWGFAENQYDYIGNAPGNTTIGEQKDKAVVDLFGWSTPNNNYGITTSNDTGTYSGDFKDWGTAFDDSGTWFTLSKDEWSYLIGATSPGRSASLCKKDVNVCGTKCLVIAPDNWDITAYPLQSEYSDYSSPLTWSQAENLGLVCLPVAGRRDGSYVYRVGENGYCWSSTAKNAERTYYLCFDGMGVDGIGVSLDSYNPRNWGNSVRLVCVAH